jgi:hypothetical protein
MMGALVEIPPPQRGRIMSNDSKVTEVTSDPTAVEEIHAAALEALPKAVAFYLVAVLDEGDTFSVESYSGATGEGSAHVAVQQVLEDMRELGFIREVA